MSKLIIPKTTTTYRESAIPKAADLLFDTDINKMVIGDGVTPGGIVINATGGTAGTVDPGFHIEVYGTTVGLKRFNAIENLVSGGTVYSGHAYKLNATSASGTTIYAEEFADGSFGLESHLEIMVNSVGYLHLGNKSGAAPFTLEGALEPDAMNNVTVRFHDGVAVMTVEDHIGGYLVISGGTSSATAGTLPYALVNTGSDASPYIVFSSELNGTPLDLAGTTVTTERHVVGNGYDQTVLGGTVSVGSSGTLTLAALGLNNTVVAGGTLTLGDVYIPNGATVAVSGGGLAIEKVTGTGSESVIDLGGTNVVLGAGAVAKASGCTFSGGSNNAGLLVSGGQLVLDKCVVSGNTNASGAGGGLVVTNYPGYAELTSCVISGNSANGGGGAYVLANAKAYFTDCVISGNNIHDLRIGGGGVVSLTNCDAGICVFLNGGSAIFAGSNRIGLFVSGGATNLGTVTISSGAIVDLTGNANPTPINPGSGIVVSDGCTVINSAGASVSITGGTYTKINKDGTVE